MNFKWYLTIFCISTTVFAEKPRVTVYNQSTVPILVSVDTVKRSPSEKSMVAPSEARDFFVSSLNSGRSIFMVIESNGEQKEFAIQVNSGKKQVQLTRGNERISVIDERSLNGEGGMKILYYGANEPFVYEAALSNKENQSLGGTSGN